MPPALRPPETLHEILAGKTMSGKTELTVRVRRITAPTVQTKIAPRARVTILAEADCYLSCRRLGRFRSARRCYTVGSQSRRAYPMLSCKCQNSTQHANDSLRADQSLGRRNQIASADGLDDDDLIELDACHIVPDCKNLLTSSIFRQQTHFQWARHAIKLLHDVCELLVQYSSVGSFSGERTLTTRIGTARA